MASELRTIDHPDVEGQRVLLRSDLTVPLIRAASGGMAVSDDRRIHAALPTIEELRRRGARLVLVSELRPTYGSRQAPSMRPVADRLASLTGAPVQLAPSVVGLEVRELTERLLPGQMLMLENVSFEAGEAENDPRLVSALAELADSYVNDDFAAAHKRHASTSGVAGPLPSAAGRLMEREVNALRALVDNPTRPLVAIFGGARLREKLGAMRRFIELADVVYVGGGICFPFLAAQGHTVGQSLCSREDVGRARTALVAASASAGRLALPSDFELARWGSDDGAVTDALDGVDVPEGWMALDIGRETAARYAESVLEAATVFWNGPVGRFELPQFIGGTQVVAQAVASTSATTVVGGGETLQALRQIGLDDDVNHRSSGETSMLELLEGRELPALEALLHSTPKPAPAADGTGGASSRIAPLSTG
jgi:phosphoglycerate kinase